MNNLSIKMENEQQLIKDFQSEIESLNELISEYESYIEDESADSDFYEELISDLKHQIEVLENQIIRCEYEISNITDNIYSKSNPIENRIERKQNLIDDFRHHFGYISSSNFLKMWINRFGVKELANDLKWLYRDDELVLNEIIYELKKYNENEN